MLPNEQLAFSALSTRDTFLNPLRSGEKEHLWIIATPPDPDGLVAIVSLTSLKGAKDQTVVLLKGSHEFVKWDTVVFFAQADIVPTSKIQQWLEVGDARPYPKISEQICDEIVDGFVASDFTRNRVREYVKVYREQSRKLSRSSKVADGA